MTYTFLQNYWWVLVSLLGGLLVALMFVQGATVQLINPRLDQMRKRMVLNASGRKWELTFTTLVTFGGAFFASFPLFYSTSFGGAYWVWVLLLITFVFQAVSYEFAYKKKNLLGSKFFRLALAANGVLAPFLVGTAVGTFFTGSDFYVNKDAIADASSPVISTWGSGWHGLEALGQGHAVLLGLTLVTLTTILGALYLIKAVDDHSFRKKMRKVVRIVAIPFLVLFLTWFAILLFKNGYAVEADGSVSIERSKYLQNFLQTVRNEDDAVAFFFHQPNLFKKDLHFIVSENSRRFIQQYQCPVIGGFGNDIQHFGNFNHLPHGKRHVADFLSGRNVG